MFASCFVTIALFSQNSTNNEIQALEKLFCQKVDYQYILTNELETALSLKTAEYTENGNFSANMNLLLAETIEDEIEVEDWMLKAFKTKNQVTNGEVEVIEDKMIVENWMLDLNYWKIK